MLCTVLISRGGRDGRGCLIERRRKLDGDRPRRRGAHLLCALVPCQQWHENVAPRAPPAESYLWSGGVYATDSYLVRALGTPTFRPQPAQRRLLDHIHQKPGFRTIHEFCALAGVARTTYYRWCQDPDFCRWFAPAWSARLLMDGTVLLDIARLNSTRSFSYWKALFEVTFDPKGLGYLQN